MPGHVPGHGGCVLPWARGRSVLGRARAAGPGRTRDADADSCICSGTALKADDSHAKHVLPLLAALLPESFESSTSPLLGGPCSRLCSPRTRTTGLGPSGFTPSSKSSAVESSPRVTRAARTLGDRPESPRPFAIARTSPSFRNSRVTTTLVRGRSTHGRRTHEEDMKKALLGALAAVGIIAIAGVAWPS